MFMGSWTSSFGKAGMDFSGITSPRPGSLIIGNFVLKFSPSGFGILLTHSNLRRSNAQWEHFSERNENHSVAHLEWRDDAHARAFMTKLF